MILIWSFLLSIPAYLTINGHCLFQSNRFTFNWPLWFETQATKIPFYSLLPYQLWAIFFFRLNENNNGYSIKCALIYFRNLLFFHFIGCFNQQKKTKQNEAGKKERKKWKFINDERWLVMRLCSSSVCTAYRIWLTEFHIREINKNAFSVFHWRL